jgi:hypothetical protein
LAKLKLAAIFPQRRIPRTVRDAAFVKIAFYPLGKRRACYGVFYGLLITLLEFRIYRRILFDLLQNLSRFGIKGSVFPEKEEIEGPLRGTEGKPENQVNALCVLTSGLQRFNLA